MHSCAFAAGWQSAHAGAHLVDPILAIVQAAAIGAASAAAGLRSACCRTAADAMDENCMTAVPFGRRAGACPGGVSACAAGAEQGAVHRS